MSGAGAPTRPPACIEDFLWYIHSVLVAVPGPLALDQLRDAYSKHLGHKCSIERFLVVGEAGLAVTLKRIPHVVTLFQNAEGAMCVKPTQAAEMTKQQLIEADMAYRKELIKKNAQAKAANASKAKAKATDGAASPVAGKASPAGAPAQLPPQPPPAKAATGEKRPAPDAAAGDASAAGADAKRAKVDGDNTLTRMLVQGVVRVLQNRQKAGKGPLPMDELEAEFKALWKVPFSLEQAQEKDPVTFLQKWPHKVEVYQEGGQHLVRLAGKAPGAASPGPAAAKKAGPGDGAATPTKSVASPPAPVTVSPAKATPPPKGPPPAAAAAASPAPKSAPPTATASSSAPSAKVGPPASIEDFLYYVHQVLEAHGGPLPLGQLKEAYAELLGHRFAIERFLVVGEQGVAVTLKRIPHIVTIINEKDGSVFLKASQPNGTTREGLVAADQAYRKQLAQRSAAAKSGSVAKAAPAASAPEQPAQPTAKAPPVPQAPPAPAAALDKDAQGNPDSKRPRTEDADTLARMLVQGITRVLQNRAKDNKGPLPIASLEEEFKALWKVPFSLQQAGETDAVVFLQKWPNKVEVITEGGQHLVQLAKKTSEKAKPAAQKAAPPIVKAPAAPVVEAPALQKAPPPSKAAVAASPPPLVPAPKAALTPAQANETVTSLAASPALADVRRQAAGMLQTIEDMVTQQRAVVAALAKLDP